MTARRSDGEPLTRSMSSGANSTIRSSPASPFARRARPLTRIRFRPDAPVPAVVQLEGGEAAPASTVPDDIAKWQAQKPATNLEYAQWILDAEAHGFVKFLNPKRSKVQIESLRDGRENPQLVLFSRSDGTPGLNLRDRSGEDRVILDVDTQGSLSIYDADGQARIFLGLANQSATPYLRMRDQAGKERLWVGQYNDGVPHIDISDAAERAIWTAP